MTPIPPDGLPFTGDQDADALLVREPMALLIGFVLDQQVSIQKAFSGLRVRRPNRRESVTGRPVRGFPDGWSGCRF